MDDGTCEECGEPVADCECDAIVAANWSWPLLFANGFGAAAAVCGITRTFLSHVSDQFIFWHNLNMDRRDGSEFAESVLSNIGALGE